MKGLHLTGKGLAIFTCLMILVVGCGKNMMRESALSEQGRKANASVSIPSSFPSASSPTSPEERFENIQGADDLEAGQDRVAPDVFTELPDADAAESFPYGDVQTGEPGVSYPESEYSQARRQAELATASTGLRDVFFELDSWRLTMEAKRVLESNALWLKAHRHEKITIEGHCDERGTRAYNYALGYKRAMVTHKYLASLGVSPDQLLATSYGKDKPTCGEFAESCFQKNRRAHLVTGFRLAATQP